MEHPQQAMLPPEISFSSYFADQKSFPQYYPDSHASEDYVTEELFYNTYTPSYGSPQDTSALAYDSHDSSTSFSDYDPSDGCSSSGSSGFPSPQMTTEMLPGTHAGFGVEEQFSVLNLQKDQHSQQQHVYEFDQYLKNNALVVPPSLKIEGQSLSHTSASAFSGLKLDTNVPLTSALGNNTTNFLSASVSLPPISPNTMVHCLQATADLDAPFINLLPATPITPSKLFEDFDPKGIILPHNQGFVKQEPCNDNMSDHSSHSGHSLHSNQSDQWRRKSLDSSLLRGRTPSPISHDQQANRRKSVPVDMAQRLHTMNLAPPRPARKSKTAAPFACPYDDCTKTFTRQYNLKSHLRTHTDERPFICGYEGCMRAFARQHDRKRHYNLHLGFKPHICGHCSRAFARLDALNRHLRSDNGALCAQATLPGGGAKKFKPVHM